jgi:hypothetical protein
MSRYKHTEPLDWDGALIKIANAWSVPKVCKEMRISTETFYKHVDSDESFKKLYTRAREDRGDSCMDKVEEYEQMLLRGEIEPRTAHVLIETEKWKAGKFNRGMYSDKASVELSGGITVMPAIKVDGVEVDFDID